MRTFALLVFTFFGLTLAAQMQKGDRLFSLVSSGPLTDIYTPAVEAFNVGQLFYSPSDPGAAVFLSPEYGFMLADRFALGGRLSFLYGSDIDAAYSLSPYARYYLLNQLDLMAFVQVSSRIDNGFTNDGDGVTAFDVVTATAGVQLPLGRGALLTPALNYSITEGRNTIGAGLGIELVLGRNNRSEEAAIASFGRGSIMLGGTFANLIHAKYFWGGDLSLGGHYFLNERFALGLGASYGFTRVKYSNPVGDFIYNSSNITVSVVPRVYLSTQRHVVWYVDGGVHYRRSGQTFGASGDTRSDGRFSIGIGGGAQIFVRDNVALEIGPQYRYFFDDENFGLLGLNVGIRYFL